MGCIWDARGGRGKEAYRHHLIRSLLDRQPHRTRCWRGLVAGQTGQAQIKSDQTRPNRQTCSRVLCSWAGRGERRLLPSPSLSAPKPS